MVANPPAGFANDITTSWAVGGLMALDGSYNVGVTWLDGGIYQSFGTIGTGGVSLIPAIEHGETGQYLHAVKIFAARFAPGLGLEGPAG
ncbi:hypothetical protein ACF1BQ_027780 [Bradyrhizobium sp. RDT10]